MQIMKEKQINFLFNKEIVTFENFKTITPRAEALHE
jgi:hypothetical protein